MMRIIERYFSDCEDCPSLLLANLHVNSNVERNLDVMDEVVQIAHDKNIDIVIFPELCVSGYVWDDENEGEIKELLETAENSRIAPRIKRMKDSLRSDGKGPEYIFYNNVRRRGGDFYNSTFILHHDLDYNSEDLIYDKIFLPPVEKKYFKEGTDKRLTIRTKWGNFGFLICYDLCFVELARKYMFKDHVDTIITMAHWRSEAVREYARMNVRTDHYYGFLWDLMNSSKAAYNQVWSVGVNAVGTNEKTGNYFWGGSGIWAPSGMTIVQASNITHELLMVHNIDLHAQRTQEKHEFDYHMDFKRFYKKMEEAGSSPLSLM